MTDNNKTANNNKKSIWEEIRIEFFGNNRLVGCMISIAIPFYTALCVMVVLLLLHYFG